MNFLRSFLASLLAVIVGFLVAIPLIFIVLTGIFASLGQKEEVTVNPGSVIHMKLNSPIVENQEPSPFDFNFGVFWSTDLQHGTLPNHRKHRKG